MEQEQEEVKKWKRERLAYCEETQQKEIKWQFAHELVIHFLPVWNSYEIVVSCLMMQLLLLQGRKEDHCQPHPKSQEQSRPSKERDKKHKYK